MTELVYKEMSYLIVGVLFEVFKEIGYGHKEYVYQKAISLYLTKNQLQYDEQIRFDLIVLGEKITTSILDFLIEDKIILEIKSRSHFRTADYRQVLRYLKTTNKKLAILATFTPGGVRYRRVLNIRYTVFVI